MDVVVAWDLAGHVRAWRRMGPGPEGREPTKNEIRYLVNESLNPALTEQPSKGQGEVRPGHWKTTGIPCSSLAPCCSQGVNVDQAGDHAFD